MCIFSQPVNSVANTRIFARLTPRRTQFIAYQMNYESRDNNAMILPVPVRQPAREQDMRFINLREYDSFFEDLASGFPHCDSSFNVGCSRSRFRAGAASLEVFEVGDYIASFVPTLSDFSRLDEQFTLPQSTWSRIPQYADYGFAVFQLAAGALKPHPMAFEFECRDESIFFPTMHIHDGRIHDEESFDHVLYLQHAGFDSRVYGYRNHNVPDKSTGLIRSKYPANRFCHIGRTHGIVAADLLVHRKIIRGIHPNGDTVMLTAGDPMRPSLNLKPLLPFAPWLLVGGAVAWFAARRTRLKRRRHADDESDRDPTES